MAAGREDEPSSQSRHGRRQAARRLQDPSKQARTRSREASRDAALKDAASNSTPARSTTCVRIESKIVRSQISRRTPSDAETRAGAPDRDQPQRLPRNRSRCSPRRDAGVVVTTLARARCPRIDALRASTKIASCSLQQASLRHRRVGRMGRPSAAKSAWPPARRRWSVNRRARRVSYTSAWGPRSPIERLSSMASVCGGSDDGRRRAMRLTGRHRMGLSKETNGAR